MTGLTIYRFWYKRLITRLDTASLKDVFDSSVKTEVDEEDISTNLMQDIQDISQERPSRVKQENIGKDDKSALDPSGQAINLKDGKSWAKLMNLLMQLRKVCDQYNPFFISSNQSPYMLPNAEPEPFTLGEHMVLGSGKYMLLDKLMPKLFEEGHRVLLFSGFTSYFPSLNMTDIECLMFVQITSIIEAGILLD